MNETLVPKWITAKDQQNQMFARTMQGVSNGTHTKEMTMLTHTHHDAVVIPINVTHHCNQHAR